VAAAALLTATLLTAASSQASTTRFTAVGSAEQVSVIGLAPSAQASLITAGGRTLDTKKADPLGGLLFYKVPPGKGYRVRLDSGGTESGPLTVHSDAAAPWDPSVYNQSIPDSGYGYLTTRDGTKLAIDVHPPAAPAGEPGGGVDAPALPWPTLIEYSGYGYADPAGPDSGIAILANLTGFAVVDVNMRGTGCSGGAFNYFEPLQNLDAYDVIETIAHQSWVLDHKVGMMGISYGAISQLFAAQLDPPALEAISPLSTIDATATTLYPGGILNTGFAVPWAEQRQQNAEPAGPNSGQSWAYQRIEDGDKTCAANQDLHGEASNLLAQIKANAYYNPTVADPLDPVTFVNKIHVPVFMACQWEDEQTGGHCAELAQHFTGTKLKWFNFTNGAHIDSLDPYTFDRWYDFLQLFVAHRAPAVDAAGIRALAPIIYQEAMGLPHSDVVALPVDPIQLIPTYKAALAAFEKLPEIRVLFDNGAGKSPAGTTTAGNPYPAYEHDFSSWPIAKTVADTWYLGPSGALVNQPPAAGGINWYTSNARALPLTDYGSNTGSGGLWGNASQWQWNWKQNPSGSAVSFITAPLATNTTVIGAGAVDLWVRSSTPDVDLQATISEVRPNGDETFVQDGWIQAPTTCSSSRAQRSIPSPASRRRTPNPCRRIVS
jgi:predicted acyl esterase